MKVSVYCLVYNHEKYLRDALDGFVNQKTNFDYEVFVHDDVSTDGSREIIREFAQKYPHIIKPILQTENQYSKGVKILQTHILPHMTGEYIAVCEGDDYWNDPHKLQLQVDFLDSHPDYVACVHNTIMENLQTGEKKPMFFHEADEDVTFEQAVQKGSACYQTSALMYRIAYTKQRPEFFKKARGFGDYPLAIYLTLSGKVRFLNQTMSVYRLGTGGSWTARSRANLRKNADFRQSVADMLREVDRYTEGRYTQMLEKLILENEYMALFYNESYAQMRKPPYDKFYRAESLKFRVKTYLKQYLSPAYHFYRKLAYGGKKR